MSRTRMDVAKLGDGWCPELEWYAKAVRALRELPPSDRTSWRYLAAIHGFDEAQWRDLGIISASDPLPPAGERDGRMWNQCQHQGWYFLPWHRGYLWAFEAIVAAKIEELGGPAGWALPYWNYFDEGNPDARDIPAVFLDPTMPDGSPNALADVPRGPATRLGPVPWFPSDIDLNAMDIEFFTSAPRSQGFGGGMTTFNQFGGQTGAIESDPHNSVHVILGGRDGFMSDPNLASLDPIFWLHHCNIDRLWAEWLTREGNVQESRAAWTHGPSPRHFEMPRPDGSLARFDPGQTLPGKALATSYDDLSIGTGRGNLPAAVVGEDEMSARLSTDPPPPSTLLGANDRALVIGTAVVATTIEIDREQANVAAAPIEQRVFLNLENVRGPMPSGVLDVGVRRKSTDAVPADASEPVKTIALFGLARASAADGNHGGNGISVAVDITELVKRLGHEKGSALEELEVQLNQPAGVGGGEPITVERVSLYRQAVE